MRKINIGWTVVGAIALVVALGAVVGPGRFQDIYLGPGTSVDADIENDDGGSNPARIRFLSSSAGIQAYTGSGVTSCFEVDSYTADDVLKVCGTAITMTQSFNANAGGGFSGASVEFTRSSASDPVFVVGAPIAFRSLDGGSLEWSDEGASPSYDVSLDRLSANVLSVASGDCLAINGAQTWCAASGAGASCTGACTAGSLCSDTDGDGTTNCNGSSAPCYFAVCENTSWQYISTP